MGGMANWINPKMNLPAMFSKKTSFGLDPLNIANSDPSRSAFTAPGTTDLADAQSVIDAEKQLQKDTIAKAEAAKSASEELARKRVLARQRAMVGTRTRFSPLGVGSEASTARKTLLGQ